jgi:hypothetical protein
MRKFVLIALLALCVSASCVAQTQLAGEWTGSLNAGGTTFHIAWHAIPAKDGALVSTFDNIDQGIYGIKVKSTVLADSSLTMTVDDVVQVNGQSMTLRGTFAGILNKDATEVVGTWSQHEPEQPTSDLTMKRTSPPAAVHAAPASVAGDWQGSLNAGGTELRLLLHMTAKDGGLSATLDSIDQGADDIPVSAVTLVNSKLNLTVDAVHGTYEGTVNNDFSQIKGTWSQGQPLDLVFKRAQPKVAAKPAAPSDIDGNWLGTLDAGSTKLRLIFKIVNMQDGLTAKLQSPDQNEVWISANSMTRANDKVTITLNGIGAAFEGKVAADLNSIDGTFTQGGMPLPLVVKRELSTKN